MAENPKIIFEIDADLKYQFNVWLAKNQLTQKDVLTEYIRKLIKEEN